MIVIYYFPQNGGSALETKEGGDAAVPFDKLKERLALYSLTSS